MLIFLMSITPAEYARSQTGPNDAFTINLNNVDIHKLIETVSRHTGKNFVVDPRVKATVSVISSKPISSDKLYELFLSVLDTHGYTAVSNEVITKIVPVQVGVQSAVPTVPAPEVQQESITGNDLISELFKLKHIPAQQLLEILRPLIPASANISAEPNSNIIIITDSAANIARLNEIIRKLDTPE